MRTGIRGKEKREKKKKKENKNNSNNKNKKMKQRRSPMILTLGVGDGLSTEGE